ncbi:MULTISPECIES: sugar kinase [unclassified Streptomyces]|uniref:sugar kinase n=1 Tax=unclassified Streptomyces TaxID=2593676 RepID=UPI000978F75E|nr:MULTISPECIES: sugar kinase [unclassified Streptomyces]ONI55324.1 2-dehydro-3-deoxygluconokinase [Streptomyces sp. IB2014 011-1]RDV53704.1 sugar kinase [Streptomyces sp. IB2014 011-12]CAD5952007.1 2-dehydro-3-deoxygluconate kinase [Streptomyces sp. KY70]CAD5983761.1 2-dehydro-3-deoxygluconate kinase [Streptomyces sp. KY75]
MSGPAAGTARADATTDVVCLGESMVTFLPSQPGRLADVPSFGRGIGGAESNVACALAAAGHRAAWVGRVGADGFGDHLVETIGGYGVDTSAVRRDPVRPTGIYFRTATDRGAGAHEVAYYRAGSAASAMSPANVPYEEVFAGRVLHLSGITAALSADCLELLRNLTAPRPGRPLVSFDVNHRPHLWRGGDATVLLELARRCDLVFVGEDEAEEAWGIVGAEAIRAALPEPGVVVVKRGSAGATVFSGLRPGPRSSNAGGAENTPASRSTEGAGAENAPASRSGEGGGAESGPASRSGEGGEAEVVTQVPALRVDVVAAVGAGDAFAAGFLSATLRGLPVRDRVRHGHLMAAAVLTVPGDLTEPPARDHADRLVALDDEAWGRLRLGPGWTAADRAPEEVRTP